ncbi:MAG: hypothetical protein ABI742_10425, partial [Gemmatimonadota bacterium]
MVEISINGDRIHLEVIGLDKLWALKSQLEFPIAHVQSVRHDPEPARGWFHGIKMPGTSIPGVLTAGTFYQHGEAVFFDVHSPDNTIVLELDHERYKRLVIEVAHPEAEVTKIRGV